MLKIDKKGNILRPNGTILGMPKKTGNIYRSSNRTGRIDLTTGDVFDLKEQLLGKVDVEKFETLKEVIYKINKKKEIADAKKTKKNTDSTINSEPKKETKDTYIPGLDSELIVSGKLSKMIYKSQKLSAQEKALKEINKSHGWKYTDWDELSRKENLTDSELEMYEKYINWYGFLSMHPDREFNDIYTKKFKQYLVLRALNLVPYNGTRASKSEEYKESSIKEYRKRAEHIKELKTKREARKKIREEK